MPTVTRLPTVLSSHPPGSALNSRTCTGRLTHEDHYHHRVQDPWGYRVRIPCRTIRDESGRRGCDEILWGAATEADRWAA